MNVRDEITQEAADMITQVTKAYMAKDFTGLNLKARRNLLRYILRREGLPGEAVGLLSLFCVTDTLRKHGFKGRAT